MSLFILLWILHFLTGEWSRIVSIYSAQYPPQYLNTNWCNAPLLIYFCCCYRYKYSTYYRKRWKSKWKYHRTIIKTRPSKLWESSLGNIHIRKIFTLKIFTPEKYSPLKKIHSWKIFNPENIHPKNIYPLKIFTPGNIHP